VDNAPSSAPQMAFRKRTPIARPAYRDERISGRRSE
jgi:hypothetical protein